jgi:hypothetical protein
MENSDAVRPAPSRDANPAHGVSGEMVEAFITASSTAAGDTEQCVRAGLSAAIGAGGQAVANIAPDACTGKALAFDPGVLHVNMDGSGYIVVGEDAWQLEDDRCEGVDGPEGSVHWITRLAASEMQALRDFLNGAALSQPHPVDENWRDDPSADERWNAGIDYGQTQLCAVLGVDPTSVSWDAATETLDGDVQSVIGNILTARFGDDWRAVQEGE